MKMQRTQLLATEMQLLEDWNTETQRLMYSLAMSCSFCNS